jgi:hypothetical protein
MRNKAEAVVPPPRGRDFWIFGGFLRFLALKSVPRILGPWGMRQGSPAADLPPRISRRGSPAADLPARISRRGRRTRDQASRTRDQASRRGRRAGGQAGRDQGPRAGVFLCELAAISARRRQTRPLDRSARPGIPDHGPGTRDQRHRF